MFFEVAAGTSGRALGRSADISREHCGALFSRYPAIPLRCRNTFLPARRFQRRRTAVGQRLPTLKNLTVTTSLLLLVALPLAGLSFFGARSAYEKWSVYRDYRRLEANSAVLQQIGQTVHELQKERGRSAGFLGSKGAQFGEELRRQRLASDAAHARLDVLLEGFDAARFGAEFAAQLRAAQAGLDALVAKRAEISGLTLVATESTAFYTQTIARLVEVLVAMSHLSNDAAITNGIYCYVTFLQAKEQAGIERATLSGVFSADAFTPESFRRFNQISATQETFLRVFAGFATAEQQRFLQETLTGPPVEAVARFRAIAAEKSAGGKFGVAASAWFDASTARIDLMKTVEDRFGADYAAAADAIKAAARRAFLVFSAVTALILALTAAVTVWLVRSLTRRLLAVAGTMADGSSEVTAAAAQVSAASQASAAGASEQAAALEETSAALEEVAGMTRRNADAADEAKTLSAQARTSAESGTGEMAELRQAMDAIHGSAANISKILASIDEIAFQTNVLALNAAVEAARAGDAGAGFAIVAEEVRALAQRSAQAAHETAEKVGQSVAASERGVEISARIARHFGEIVTKMRRVDALVAGIAGASREQTQGIGQVTSAVADMDRTTQSNAASAEETAAQAEQLNAQAVELRTAIGRLLTVVGGRRPSDPVATEAPRRGERRLPVAPRTPRLARA